MSDYYCIDISVDVQVRRTMTRLGLVNEGASQEELIYRARALHPEFPGLIDHPLWEIGRDWRRPTKPICTDCYLNQFCPTAQGAAAVSA